MKHSPTTPPSSSQNQSSQRAVPRAVTGAMSALLALACINVLALILFVMHRNEAVDTYEHAYPHVSLNHINDMVNTLLLSGVIPHLAFMLLLLWLAWMIRKGKSWVRVTATVIIVLEMIAHVFSLATLLVLPAEASVILSVEAVGLLLELTVLWLLWFSRSSRTYFTRGRH